MPLACGFLPGHALPHARPGSPDNWLTMRLLVGSLVAGATLVSEPVIVQPSPSPGLLQGPTSPTLPSSAPYDETTPLELCQ